MEASIDRHIYHFKNIISADKTILVTLIKSELVFWKRTEQETHCVETKSLYNLLRDYTI